MTRINVGIKPENLTDEHLLAEHREIKRIPSIFKKRIAKYKEDPQLIFDKDKIPKTFTLNTGHVLFFLNKPQYTFSRYKILHDECLQRGFEVQNYEENWNIYDNKKYYKYYKLYKPTKKDIQLIKNRVELRTKTAKCKYFHHYSCNITKSEAIEYLNK